MHAPPRHLLAYRFRSRRIVCALLLVGFGITAAGVPLPGPKRVLKSDEQFPCATSSCGCRTATQCWQSCCCHTFAERIAWARRNGVRPPQFAIAQARVSKLDLTWLDQPGLTNSCSDVTCCAANNAAATSATIASSCCAARTKIVATQSARSCCSHESIAPEQKEKRNNVIAWQALKCGGHSLNWLAAVPSLVLPQTLDPFDAAPCAWQRPVTMTCISAAAEPPVLPPPEVA